MTIYTLYVKTHKITGLKYLGQTTKNPYTYKGSGIDWKKHICEYGNDLITEILYQGPDREEMKKSKMVHTVLFIFCQNSNSCRDAIDFPLASHIISETSRKLRAHAFTALL